MVAVYHAVDTKIIVLAKWVWSGFMEIQGCEDVGNSHNDFQLI